MAVQAVFDAVTLTILYTDNEKVLNVGPGPFSLLVDFTLGSLTSLEIQVEISDDGVAWYLPVSKTGLVLGQVLTTTGQGTFRVAPGEASVATDRLGDLTSGERRMRISAKGTGTPAGNLLTLKLVSNLEYPAVSS